MSPVKACVLRIEGTNCEEEAARAFRMAGARAEIVHLKRIAGGGLAKYDILMLPGGFSAGDYVRAGAIFAARMKSAVGRDLSRFIEDGRPVIGVCNGFQILVELGALPAFDATLTDAPEAALYTNDSGRFECRPSLLEHDAGSRCIFTRHLKGRTILVPSAHAEGKLTFPAGEESKCLARLRRERMVAFRYVGPKGERSYPWNPNGSKDAIAGICNRGGNVLGMMPHPERVLDRWTLPDWTRDDSPHEAEGLGIFESAVAHASKA